MSKALVVLSGGLDSTANLLLAAQHFATDDIYTLTFDYGQRAAQKELATAKLLSEIFKVEQRVVSLPFFSSFSKSALTQGNGESIPGAQEVSINSLQSSRQTAKAVWVPNRNGIFLSIAAGFAEGLNVGEVFVGFNVEEAQTFPDNSSEFISAFNHALHYSTQGAVIVKSFTDHLNKTEIVSEIIKLGRQDILAKVWPCYHDHAEWCGNCESCLRYERALSMNGLSFKDLRRR